jgi:putative spermidine/putrescine transport system ATP-binding protein
VADPAAADKNAVSLRQVSKTYGDHVAVRGVDLDIRKGEFFTILGPSGSGKTTVLRMIAGLVAPTDGEILIDGENVAGRKPYDRDISMVFQSLALFPHMNVRSNIGFPLRMRRAGQREIDRRVSEVLEIVRLPQIEDRLVTELSGGQRQRVALARALVYQPSLLLLDEPLGALDRRLREEMQLELARLHREIDITIMNVTHDQREALMLSDRMAIMDNGTIQQVGSAEALYTEPANPFVATFIGDGVLLTGEVSKDGGRHKLRVANTDVDVGEAPRAGSTALMLRSESVRLAADERDLSDCENRFRGVVEVAIFEGIGSYCEVRVPDLQTVVKVSVPRSAQVHPLEPGTPVWIGWQVSEIPLVSP